VRLILFSRLFTQSKPRIKAFLKDSRKQNPWIQQRLLRPALMKL
jgi:hypothetical protein